MKKYDDSLLHFLINYRGYTEEEAMELIKDAEKLAGAAKKEKGE